MIDVNTDKEAQLADELGRVQATAQRAFSWVRDPGRRDDCVQDVVCFVWRWADARKEPDEPFRDYVKRVVHNAIRRVRSGRSIAGSSTVDALSQGVRLGHGVTVCGLPESDRFAGTVFERALSADDANPAELVPFKLDWEAFIAEIDERGQGMMAMLADGEQAATVADAYHVSRCRITQLRQRWQARWEALQADAK
jgi:DNA-directed RNA polymerase specialized sigma24 family protein